MIDHLDHDDEAYLLQLRLLHGHAENARLDGQELLAAGFEVVTVKGLNRPLWKPPLGPLDGSLFTTEAALREIAPLDDDGIIPDPRDG